MSDTMCPSLDTTVQTSARFLHAVTNRSPAPQPSATVGRMTNGPPAAFGTAAEASAWLGASPAVLDAVSEEYFKALRWLPASSGRRMRPERLSQEHDVSGFCSGQDRLDAWVQDPAGALAVNADPSSFHWVLAYPGDPAAGPVSAVAECCVSYAALPDDLDETAYGLVHKQLPAMFVTRAAVDSHCEDPPEALTVLALHVASLTVHMAELVPVMGLAAPAESAIGEVLQLLGGVPPMTAGTEPWAFLRILGAAERARSG